MAEQPTIKSAFNTFLETSLDVLNGRLDRFQELAKEKRISVLKADLDELNKRETEENRRKAEAAKPKNEGWPFNTVPGSGSINIH